MYYFIRIYTVHLKKHFIGIKVMLTGSQPG